VDGRLERAGLPRLFAVARTRRERIMWVSFVKQFKSAIAFPLLGPFAFSCKEGREKKDHSLVRRAY